MKPTSSKPSKFVLLPLFFTVFLDLVGLGIAIPSLAAVFLDAHVSILSPDTTFQMRTILYGLLVASFPIAQFFGAPILGALSDRHGRKPTLILSLVGTFLGYVLFAVGIVLGNVPLLFLSRAIDGFTGGNLSIAMSSIADISDDKEKGRNFGLIGMAFGLGFILGPYIGGKLSDPHVLGWFTTATPFWFAAFLTFINILLFFWLFTETLRTTIDTPISAFTGFRNLKKAFALIHMRTILLVVFLLTLGFNFFTQFFQVFLIEKFQFSQGQIGDLFAYTGIWIALSQGVFNRPLSHKFAPGQLLTSAAFFLACTLPFLLVPTQAVYIYVITPFIAVFQGLTDPNATAVVSNLTDRDSQGEIMGIKQSIQSVAQALPPLIAGFLPILVGNVVPADMTGTTHFLSISLPILLASFFTFAAWGLYVFIFRRTTTETFREV